LDEEVLEMFVALLIGSIMIIVAMAVAIALFGVAIRILAWLDGYQGFGYPRMSVVYDLGIAALWILIVLTLTVWSWAGLYISLGLFDMLEPALYFAIVSFTTVGYGDVVLDPGWRILAGMTATHGLLTFGIFTAFLVDVFRLPSKARRG